VVGGQGGWVYADGRWRKLELGASLINGLRRRVEALRHRARSLAGASRARYYIAETQEEAEIRLDGLAAELAKDITTLAAEIKTASSAAQGYEKTQLEWATEALPAALGALEKARGPLAAKVTPEAIHAADAAREALERAELALAVAPPRRGEEKGPGAFCAQHLEGRGRQKVPGPFSSPDAASRRIVLFGGDALDRLLADTWVYDPAAECHGWLAQPWHFHGRPRLSPSPRSGYKLVYLPRGGNVLLIDGYGYEGQGEMWAYDVVGAGPCARPSSRAAMPYGRGRHGDLPLPEATAAEPGGQRRDATGSQLRPQAARTTWW
jgi:hypothetical protein